MSEGFSELKAMEGAYAALEPLDAEARRRAIRWLLDTLHVSEALTPLHPDSLEPESVTHARAPKHRPGGTHEHASDSEPPSPKAFIGLKRPESVVERIACLAFYLTHYRNAQSFGGPAIAALNTEAAAPKLNPHRDLDNADRRNGFIVSAGDRKKQITSRGEALVNALPDRGAVKQVLQEFPHKQRRPSGAAKRRTQANGDGE